jgi:hypothetical protein
LKRAAFELAILAISQHYNMENDTLTIDDVTLPIQLFNCSDPNDMEFGRELIQCIHSLAAFRLNNREIALLSAIVLMDSSDSQQDFVIKVREHLYAEFASRFEETPLALYNRLWNLVNRLRGLSRRHIVCLSNFERSVPEHVVQELPPLYKELFSYDAV